MSKIDPLETLAKFYFKLKAHLIIVADPPSRGGTVGPFSVFVILTWSSESSLVWSDCK